MRVNRSREPLGPGWRLRSRARRLTAQLARILALAVIAALAVAADAPPANQSPLQRIYTLLEALTYGTIQLPSAFLRLPLRRSAPRALLGRSRLWTTQN